MRIESPTELRDLLRPGIYERMGRLRSRGSYLDMVATDDGVEILYYYIDRARALPSALGGRSVFTLAENNEAMENKTLRDVFDAKVMAAIPEGECYGRDG